MVIGGGGIVFVLLMLFLAGTLMPVLIILVLKNLQVYSGLSSHKATAAYVFTWVVISLIQYLLAKVNTVSFITQSFYFFLYVLAALYLTYALRPIIKNNAKLYRAVAAVITLIVIGTIWLVEVYPQRDKNPVLEEDLVKALNLKLLARDTLYNASHIKVFGDTVVGYHYDIGADEGRFFAHSLKNKLIKQQVKVDAMQSFQGNPFYKNGCYYIAGLNEGMLRKIDADANTTHLIKHPSNDYGIVLKYTNYKNLIIVSTTGGRFLIFDESKDKIVFEGKGQFLDNFIGNTFFFVNYDEVSSSPTTTCLNLNNFRPEWKYRTPAAYYFPRELYSNDVKLAHNKHYIAIPGKENLALVDIKTGNVKMKYNWIDTLSSYPNICRLDETRCYVSNGQNLECVDIASGKLLWRIKNAYLYGLNKDNVVAVDSAYEKFIVLDNHPDKKKPN